MVEAQLFTADQVASLVNNADMLNRARIASQISNKPFRIQTMTLDLSTTKLAADPYRIGFPFKSIFIADATDIYANIQCLLGTRDTFQSAFTMKQNASINMDYPVNEAYLYWTAQSGKSITLTFFVDATFSSGSQISVTGGGVSIVDGSSFTTTNTLLVAATITSVLASNSLRKVASIQNNTGASLFLGGSSVSPTASNANLGYELVAGGIFQWRNTAQLYAYSTGGGRILIFEEQ